MESSSNYGSSAHELYLGLGGYSTAEVDIHWLNGEETSLGEVKLNGAHSVGPE